MDVKQIAIVDVESTSSTHHAFGGMGRVIQWGMILLDVPDLHVIESRQTLVKLDHLWFKEADPEAMAIHKITEPDVQQSIRPRFALQEMFEEGINWNKTCFASWGSFDLEMLRGEYETEFGKRPPVRYRALDVRSACGVVDLADTETSKWSYVGSHQWAERHGVSLRTQPDLQRIAGDKKAHDALYDCAIISACLRRVVEKV